MVSQGASLTAWSVEDVGTWLASIGFDDLKSAALKKGGEHIPLYSAYYDFSLLQRAQNLIDSCLIENFVNALVRHHSSNK